MAEPTILGAIDAGSNAIRVIVSSATSATNIETVVAERVPVRLGAQTFTTGELSAKSIELAIGAFSRFAKLFEQYGVSSYRAIATSAVRAARNREDLIDRLYRELGLQLEVIDGQEEARLVRKAVNAQYPIDTRPGLIVDLGGGSLEITGAVKSRWTASSMKIGTVRLMETFGLTGATSEDEARLITRYVGSMLRSHLPESGFERGEGAAVACGGNAEALAHLFGGKNKAGLATLKRTHLQTALEKILPHDVEGRMSRLKVRRDRAEVIGVAAIVFAAVADALDISKFEVPGVGIRDGLLLDLAESTVGQLETGVDAAAVASARAFADRLGHNTVHGEQVRRIAMRLFDELPDLHGLPKKLSPVLQVAALLHDIGEVVHRRSHHKHSEYLILNGRIPSLGDAERDMAAAVARAHRKSKPDTKKHLTYAGLPFRQQEHVRKMAALLRVADSLDADHRHRILSLHAQNLDDRVELRATMGGSGNEEVTKKVLKDDLFAEEFGKPIVVEVTEVFANTRRTAVSLG